MDINIRPANLSDLPVLAKINSMNFPEEENIALERLPEFISENSLICAEKEGKIVGLLYWKNKNEGERELTQITIDNQYRSQGIGSLLLNKFLELSKDSKINKITADIRPENTASRSLVKKFGGREVGTKNFGEKEDRILIEFKNF